MLSPGLFLEALAIPGRLDCFASLGPTPLWCGGLLLGDNIPPINKCTAEHARKREVVCLCMCECVWCMRVGVRKRDGDRGRNVTPYFVLPDCIYNFR